MLVGAEEKVEPRLIKVLRTVGDTWLVNEGLKAGDRVIVEGLQKARPGTPVKAVPFSEALQKPAPPVQPTAARQAAPSSAKNSQTNPASQTGTTCLTLFQGAFSWHAFS